MIDEIDSKILNILQEKARIPNVEVARQVGMAPSAVLERIRKLEKNGIIDGYEVRLNPDRFNRRLIAFVFVYTNGSGASSASDIGAQLARIPEIQEVHFVSGEDCFFLKLRVADTGELGRLLEEKISVVKGIRKTKTLSVLATQKETAQFPVTLNS